MRLVIFLFFCLGMGKAAAVEIIPSAPDKYLNDYSHILSPATAERLNRQLEDFEKATSNQMLVVIYPKMLSDSALEDYAVRVARAWRVGQKARNNGAILFIFAQDRKMRIEVGYGLEGALPDAIAKRIIEEELKPHFQRGDYDGGLVAGVNAMLQAARGEYKGTGRTVGSAKSPGSSNSLPAWVFFGLFGIIILFALRRAAARGTIYRGSGRTTYWGSAGGWSGGGWTGGGGGFGGGGGSGGGFSGGGGSFGGGGASGSW